MSWARCVRDAYLWHKNSKAACLCFNFSDNCWISKATQVSDLIQALLVGIKRVSKLVVRGQGGHFRLWTVSSHFLAETILQNSSVFTKNDQLFHVSCVLYYGGGTRILGMKTSLLPMGTIHTSTLLVLCSGADMQYELVWWIEICLFLSPLPWILESEGWFTVCLLLSISALRRVQRKGSPLLLARQWWLWHCGAGR